MAEESAGASQPSPPGLETETSGSGNGMSEESPGSRPWFARTWAALNMSLSRIQAIVGLVAGIISVTGALYSVTQFFKPAPGTGEVVAVVHDARSAEGVPDATIEILTPQDALVATLRPDSSGRARQTLKEGTYKVRASHPRYAAEIRQIQVFSRQTVEVNLRLRAGSSSPLRHVTRAVNGGVNAVRRVLGF